MHSILQVSPSRPPLRAADAFNAALARYRGELHVYGYRLLGSFADAEAVVGETLVRMQRERDYARERAALQRRLYGIATEAALDFLRANDRRTGSGASIADMLWLQPYPDRLLDAVERALPDAAGIARSTIDLTFLGTLQLLTLRQRAVLVLRSIHGWSAADTAATLGMTVTAVNSALQRARAALRDRRNGGETLPDRTTDDERATVDRWIMLRREADSVRANGIGEWVRVPTDANRQPALANYVRRGNAVEYTAHGLDVLRVARDRVVEVVSFPPRVFAWFELPAALPVRRR
ncbi:MAG TPA: sigma factor-like helix-turn-helix DNA-binding protein [Candidatus Sulfotelmatobacter sp.]|nr:sigma factor-like helix-turn-helix DNA-binding protein [Candidatus Sulfotelmatobacter sp.]